MSNEETARARAHELLGFGNAQCENHWCGDYAACDAATAYIASALSREAALEAEVERLRSAQRGATARADEWVERATVLQADLTAVRGELVRVEAALEAAAASLETVSRWALGPDEDYSDGFNDIKPYAKSRANVARAALATLDAALSAPVVTPPPRLCECGPEFKTCPAKPGVGLNGVICRIRAEEAGAPVVTPPPSEWVKCAACGHQQFIDASSPAEPLPVVTPGEALGTREATVARHDAFAAWWGRHAVYDVAGGRALALDAFIAGATFAQSSAPTPTGTGSTGEAAREDELPPPMCINVNCNKPVKEHGNACSRACMDVVMPPAAPPSEMGEAVRAACGRPWCATCRKHTRGYTSKPIVCRACGGGLSVCALPDGHAQPERLRRESPAAPSPGDVYRWEEDDGDYTFVSNDDGKVRLTDCAGKRCFFDIPEFSNRMTLVRRAPDSPAAPPSAGTPERPQDKCDECGGHRSDPAHQPMGHHFKPGKP